MKIYPLYSSSSGNLFCLELENSNILIDCGVSYKAVCDGLKSIYKSINDISAILITHEHIDHIKALPILCKKNNIPIYTCEKTANYLKDFLLSNGTSPEIHSISYNKSFEVNKAEITAFRTSHDAAEPCGYSICENNKVLTFATDLGHVSEEVFEYMKASDFLVIESNYDLMMLEYGKYPYPLKQRIKSSFGHLSNDETANTILSLVKENNKNNFLLSHMSENNNSQYFAKQTLENTFKQNDLNYLDVNINFASKTLSSEAYEIC
ncbi:MAG: MBL fold metallo-hydrolase [Clostridia bacterium]|nr:MBL fold metallo-hydrolase [Clostridia bacterium]